MKNKFLIHLAEGLKQLILLIAGAHLALSIEKETFNYYYWFYGFGAVGMYIVFSIIENYYRKEE